MSDSHVVPETPCPMCGYVIDRAAPVADAPAPQKGDFSVCFGCACILVFDTCSECDGLGVRLPVIEEAIELETLHQEAARQLAQAQAAVLHRLRQDKPDYVPPWMKSGH